MSTGWRGTRPGSHGSATGGDYGEQRQQHLNIRRSHLVSFVRIGTDYPVSRFVGSFCFFESIPGIAASNDGAQCERRLFALDLHCEELRTPAQFRLASDKNVKST